MKKPTLFLLFAFALLSACSGEKDAKDTAALIGNWQGAEWLVFDKPVERNVTAVKFEFNTDGQYSANYGDQTEKGVYKVKSGKLYTTAEDKIEKAVKILQLSPDTLTLQMNRVGQEEKLVLIRK